MLPNLKAASRWLNPGLGLKRWLAPLMVGLVILGLGLGLLIIELQNRWLFPALPTGAILSTLGLLLSLLGLGLAAFSIYRVNRIILGAFLPDEASLEYIANEVYRHRQRRQQGPKIVVIGGGTGLSNLLRGLKHHTDNITAIVTVADDGGSSGKLRRELGVLPPGDFRNCIAALADDESLTTQLFQYRFRSGQGLEGHSFGNLFITAMAEVTGSFEQAVYESGRVLKIRGSILPSTLQDVTLFAELKEGDRTLKVAGESMIPAVKLPIERVYLQPDEPLAFPPALHAILNADMIIGGPGSLYTSVIPNLLVPEIAAAIRASTAPKLYICNVATQPGETDNYTLDDHVQAIEAHTIGLGGPADSLDHPGQVDHCFFEYVVANNQLNFPIPAEMSHLQPVLPDTTPGGQYMVLPMDVVDEQHPWRHDSVKLAQALIDWYKQFRVQSGTLRK